MTANLCYNSCKPGICRLMNDPAITRKSLGLTSLMLAVGIALVGSVANYVVEPLGTKVLLERYALENASGPKDKEKIKSLKGKFGAFHGLSSLLNLVVLVAICAHGYWLSSHLALA